MTRRIALASAAAACTTLSAVAFALPGPVAAASTPFVVGTATATAQAMQLTPRNGGFAYTITVGGTVADYRGTLAQAQSQSLDLGLIGTSITAEGCDGSKPAISRDQLPQPLIAESDHGNTSKSADDYGTTQSGVLAASGHKSVAVTTTPSSTADFDGGAIGIQGVVEASGMSSGAGAKLVPGRSRIATADARIGRLSLLGGLAVFHDLHWTAAQQTGAGAHAAGTFTVGDATVAGQTFPAGGDAAKTAFDAVNAALAQSGVHVTIPGPRKTADGSVVVPPLEIGIDNSALGAAVVNPLLTATQPVWEQIEKAILGFSCRFGTVFTLRDIFLAAVDGTGGLTMKLGGVTAGSDGTSYGNPFGTVSLGSSSGAPLAPTSSNATSTASGSPGLGGAAPPPATAGVTPPAAAAPQVAGSTNLAASCATTSPAKWPKCSNGAALAVGLLGLAAVGAVAGGDWLATRRRRRMPQLDL